MWVPDCRIPAEDARSIDLAVGGEQIHKRFGSSCSRNAADFHSLTLGTSGSNSIRDFEQYK